MNEIEELSVEDLKDLGYTKEDIDYLFSWQDLDLETLKEHLKSKEESKIRYALRHLRLCLYKGYSKSICEELDYLIKYKNYYTDETRALLYDALWSIGYKSAMELQEIANKEKGKASLSTIRKLVEIDI